MYETDQLIAYLDRVLDRTYTRITASVIKRISKGDPVLERRFKDLLAEAEADGRIDLSGPNYVAFMADLEDSLDSYVEPIQEAGQDLVMSAIINAFDALTEFTWGAEDIPKPGDPGYALAEEKWYKPPEDNVLKILEPRLFGPWELDVSKYADRVLGDVRNIAVSGVLAGQNPLTTAQQIKEAADYYPLYIANALMRTVQLTSYRDASVAYQTANADMLQEQIRIAALDDRTCMSCVNLHGSVLMIGERVDDHYNGRCTSICVVKGVARPEVMSGADWFDSLSPERQRAQMGPGAYNAWQAGEIQLSDFSHEIQDPVFGRMIEEASLKGMLGRRAEKFYQRNRTVA